MSLIQAGYLQASKEIVLCAQVGVSHLMAEALVLFLTNMAGFGFAASCTGAAISKYFRC